MSDPFDVPQGSSESDYDITTLIYVDGAGMTTAATALKTQATNVANSITAINNAISGLKLGWAGATEQEASDFIDRWNSAAIALFGADTPAAGSKPSASDGVLNVLAECVQGTVDNFNEAETEVLKNFTQMFTSLAPSTTSGSNPTGSEPTGTTTTPPAGSDPVILS